VPSKENPSGIGSSRAFAAPTASHEVMPAVDAATPTAPTQKQPAPCVSDVIPQCPLPLHPVLELASLGDVHVDMLADDMEQVHSKPWEELEVPQVQNVQVTHTSFDAHVLEHSSAVDLEASASAREMSPTQLDLVFAHDDVHTSSQIGRLVVRSIPEDTTTFLAMEKLVQNYTVEHPGTDVNAGSMSTLEPHSNLNIQHDLYLWLRVRDYDKDNAELQFIPVLSKKQKQQVKKQLQIGKPSPYKTRSQGGSNSGSQ